MEIDVQLMKIDVQDVVLPIWLFRDGINLLNKFPEYVPTVTYYCYCLKDLGSI